MNSIWISLLAYLQFPGSFFPGDFFPGTFFQCNISRHSQKPLNVQIYFRSSLRSLQIFSTIRPPCRNRNNSRQFTQFFATEKWNKSILSVTLYKHVVLLRYLLLNDFLKICSHLGVFQIIFLCSMDIYFEWSEKTSTTSFEENFIMFEKDHDV